MTMDLYEAVAELRQAARHYADLLEADDEASSNDIDRIDDALETTQGFLQLLKGS